MEELKELTPEQEALMPVVAKEYIDMFYSFKEIDKKRHLKPGLAGFIGIYLKRIFLILYT
jgi:hypothetical protein